MQWRSADDLVGFGQLDRLLIGAACRGEIARVAVESPEVVEGRSEIALVGLRIGAGEFCIDTARLLKGAACRGEIARVAVEVPEIVEGRSEIALVGLRIGAGEFSSDIARLLIGAARRGEIA